MREVQIDCESPCSDLKTWCLLRSYILLDAAEHSVLLACARVAWDQLDYADPLNEEWV